MARVDDPDFCLDRGPKLSERHVFTLTGVQEGGGGTTRAAAGFAAGRETHISFQVKPTHLPPFAARQASYASLLNLLVCAFHDEFLR